MRRKHGSVTTPEHQIPKLQPPLVVHTNYRAIEHNLALDVQTGGDPEKLFARFVGR